jgi:hypothetical protein
MPWLSEAGMSARLRHAGATEQEPSVVGVLRAVGTDGEQDGESIHVGSAEPEQSVMRIMQAVAVGVVQEATRKADYP